MRTIRRRHRWWRHGRHFRLYRLPRNRLDGDAGSVSILVVLAAFALLVAIGLAADGGAKIRAVQQANAYAEEAARAGGQAINAGAAVAGDAPTLDPAAAVFAAEAYLRAAGVEGTATPTSATTLAVEVTVHRDTVFLGLIGLDRMTVQARAEARLATGPE